MPGPEPDVAEQVIARAADRWQYNIESGICTMSLAAFIAAALRRAGLLPAKE